MDIILPCCFTLNDIYDLKVKLLKLVTFLKEYLNSFVFLTICLTLT